MAAKAKAAAKKTSARVRCFTASAVKAAPVNESCLAEAEQKFGDAWARIEGDGGCLVVGDEDSIELKVDAYVDDVVRTLQPCGEVGGACGGGCASGQFCLDGIGCSGEVVPCSCYTSVTTCPTTSSTTTTSTTTCATHTTITLGRPPCGLYGGSCSGGCENARECVPDDSGVCGCTGPIRPCGLQIGSVCGGSCPVGETCIEYRPLLPDGCPGEPRCGCVASP